MENGPMELRELRSFCTAVRLRSLTKAAYELGLGQPTVTFHIKKLEKDLGKALLDRMRRPIQPTLAGAKLAELAAPLLEGIDALIDDTSEAEEKGPVKVGASHVMIARVLLEASNGHIVEAPMFLEPTTLTLRRNYE